MCSISRYVIQVIELSYTSFQAIDVWMGLCTAFVFAALVEFTIVNFWFRKHRKRKENALPLMLPFVSTASNLTAATQMSAATKTENTMRANQKKVKNKF